MLWCSGESKGFSSSSNLTSSSLLRLPLLLLLWALQLFVSFGLLNSFLTYFSLHSNLTPILNFHFCRSTLTSSISSFLPGCNIVLVFHEPIWKTPFLIHLTCSVHLWLIRPSFPRWAFLAYYFFTLIGYWPIKFSLAPLLQPSWQGRPACSYATAGVAVRVIGTCMPPCHVKA